MYHFLPRRLCMFVSSKGVSMENRKIYPLICALVGAMILLCNKADAQLNAQSDIYNVLQNSCSSNLDVTANDNLNTLQIDTLYILSGPQNGTASASGRFLSYCPQQGYTGADNFTYRISAGGQIGTATVYVNVLSYNNFIFAGDADQNGRVENFDVLALGLAYGATGPTRPDMFTVNALAWDPLAYINSNPGAADCNGDGIVDSTDLQQIEIAYHDTFPAPPRFDIDTSVCGGEGIPFYIQPLLFDTVYDGDTIDINFMLGNNGMLNSAYGIAFTLQFDTRFIPGYAAQFFTGSSWVLQNNSGLFFSRSFQNTGEIEIALTRTDHISGNGNGVTLRARLPIDDNIDGIMEGPGTHPINLLLKKVRLISPYNIVQNVCIEQPSLTFYKTASGIREEQTGHAKIYPNPASSLLVIEAESIREIEITDITGRKIYVMQTSLVDRVQLNLKDLSLAPGNYFVKVKTSDFVSTQKIFVQH